MKCGDLVYHVDDWADKKPVVGIILGLDGHLVKVTFTDKGHSEWWPKRELERVYEVR